MERQLNEGASSGGSVVMLEINGHELIVPTESGTVILISIFLLIGGLMRTMN